MRKITLTLEDDKGIVLWKMTDDFDQIVAMAVKMFNALGIEVSRIDAEIGAASNWVGLHGTSE